MAEASEVGLEADFRKVPIRQETIEVCEIFDLNPYKLQADGAVLIGIRGGEALVQRLRNEDLWQRSSVRQTVAMTGFSTAVAVPDIWNVRQRMNCRKFKRRFSKKDRRLITRGIKTKWQN